MSLFENLSGVIARVLRERAVNRLFDNFSGVIARVVHTERQVGTLSVFDLKSLHSKVVLRREGVGERRSRREEE
jgi:hypothetical protein